MKETRGIYKRGDTYWLSFQKDGKRQWYTLETTDLVTAIERAAELRKITNRQKTGTIDDLRERFLLSKQSQKIYKRRTHEWSDTVLRRLASFTHNATPSAVTPSMLHDWLKALRSELKESSVQSYFRAVRSFFSWLMAEKLIHEDPCKTIKLPKFNSARTTFCTAKERDLLISKSTDDDMTFILLAGFDAGMRKDEIIEARPHWFDLTAGVIHIQETSSFKIKNMRNRTVPMTARFLKFMKNLEPRSPFILAPNTIQGAAIYRYDFRLPFDRHVTACELDWVTPHVMRHTFASLLVSAGVSIYKVAMWIGDTVATTEKHYAHLFASDSDIEKGVHFGKSRKQKTAQAADLSGHPSSLARVTAARKSARA